MKVTTKGQVTIPARVRDYLGITPHTDVTFQIAGGSVVLVKNRSVRKSGSQFSALRGVLKGRLTTEAWMRATRNP